MQTSYRFTVRDAPALSVVEAKSGPENARLNFGTCFMIWAGLIASTWAMIAFVVSLL